MTAKSNQNHGGATPRSSLPERQAAAKGVERERMQADADAAQPIATDPKRKSAYNPEGVVADSSLPSAIGTPEANHEPGRADFSASGQGADFSTKVDASASAAAQRGETAMEATGSSRYESEATVRARGVAEEQAEGRAGVTIDGEGDE